MASIALHLKYHPHKPTFSLLYSSSSSSSNDNFSPYFNDIKSKLKQQQQSSPTRDIGAGRDGGVSGGDGGGGYGGGGDVQKVYPFSSSFTDITAKLRQHEQQRQSTGFFRSRSNSNDEIMRNLSEFRSRAVDSSSGFPEKRDVGASLQTIKESLKHLRMSPSDKGTNKINSMSFNSNINSGGFTGQSRMANRGGGGGNVFGGSALPMAVFGKEIEETKMKKGVGDDGGEDDVWMKTFSRDELGKKLRELRPERKGENWFSLSELNERLKKVKENDNKGGNASTLYPELRRSLQTISDEKTKTYMGPLQGFDIVGPGLPSFMLSPPKEHLVEKYFHPDNMSAGEKLKLELKKVRDEFKMHESDCGSARVQIAVLTTEILHLSSVLHKKDKHSRRGLQAKVQQRKKLLKYLRRTDWESYCFVLSKLGLRDNPDYKN